MHDLTDAAPAVGREDPIPRWRHARPGQFSGSPAWRSPGK
jgi:hypothetical protein